jgi:hypothetical protein
MTDTACKHPRHYVDLKERLTRFVYDASHIKNKRVRHDVFVADRHNEVSVYRTNARPPEYIWKLCAEAARQGTKDAVGRAEIKAGDVASQGLRFDPDGKPHTRHVAIVGWIDKSSDLERRKILALAATPFMRPD